MYIRYPEKGMRLTKYTTAIAANYSPLAMQLYHIALGIVNNLFSFFPFFNLRLAAVREDYSDKRAQRTRAADDRRPFGLVHILADKRRCARCRKTDKSKDKSQNKEHVHFLFIIHIIHLSRWLSPQNSLS